MSSYNTHTLKEKKKIPKDYKREEGIIEIEERNLRRRVLLHNFFLFHVSLTSFSFFNIFFSAISFSLFFTTFYCHPRFIFTILLTNKFYYFYYIFIFLVPFFLFFFYYVPFPVRFNT